MKMQDALVTGETGNGKRQRGRIVAYRDEYGFPYIGVTNR